MIKWLSNILTRAGIVKNELVENANSAPRIGQLFEDLARLGVTKFDPAVAYETGQYAIYGGVLAEVITDTTAGQTPDSHPLKWSLKLVIDPAQITVSNNLPVAASAIAKRIAELAGGAGGSVPNATTTTAGKVRQATADEAKAGVVADAYITPKHMHDELTLVLEEFTKPTIDSVLANGFVTNRSVRLGNISNLNPFFVNNIQAVKIAYQAVPGGEWFDVLISQTDFRAIVSSWVTLENAVGNGNITEGTAVFGGLGLFPRVEAPFSTEVAVYVPGPVINGKQVTFIEKQNSADFLLTNMERWTEAQKIRARSALSPAPDVVGVVIGRRCITVDESSQVGEWTEFIVTAIADGAPITHTLDLSNGFLQQVYRADGRLYDGAWVDATSPTVLTFQHPSVSDAFTGKVLIKPNA